MFSTSHSQPPNNTVEKQDEKFKEDNDHRRKNSSPNNEEGKVPSIIDRVLEPLRKSIREFNEPHQPIPDPWFYRNESKEEAFERLEKMTWKEIGQLLLDFRKYYVDLHDPKKNKIYQELFDLQMRVDKEKNDKERRDMINHLVDKLTHDESDGSSVDQKTKGKSSEPTAEEVPIKDYLSTAKDITQESLEAFVEGYQSGKNEKPMEFSPSSDTISKIKKQI